MIFRKTLLFSLFVTLVSICFVSNGQTLQDFQNIKVDNLSDAQVEQLIKRMEAAGMDEQQMFNLAAERGMPASELLKLRQRIGRLRSGGITTQYPKSERGRLRQVQGMEGPAYLFDSLRKADPYYDLSPKEKMIFGYKLFHNRNLDFSPSLNVPTPQNYTVGAGDQLLIDIYGASQQSYDVTVNPDGKIFIPNVGPIQVGGATIGAVISRIKSALTRIYAGLSGSNPNTFIELRLGNIRTVTISLVGELVSPGTYTLPSFASPFNALFAAGGPNENGSFRHIQIYRDSRLLQEVDVYEFLMKGEFTSPITLKDNDVIIVPPVRNRVEIQGPVRREGLYEMKPGENIDDLISFTGGFSSKAYSERVTLTRKTGTEMRIEDVDAADFDTFSPQDGDLIRVGEILDRFANRVQISGAVLRPGTFALSDGMGIRELVEKAQGIREDAFSNRATIYRTQADFSLDFLPVDIKKILSGEVDDVPLEREDVLYIPSIYDLREEYYVKISGEVNRPGAFPFGDNMTVADLVVKAGGFKESATSSRVEIARRVKDDISGKLAEIILLDVDRDLRILGTRAQEPLMPFDHVIIRRSPGFQREQLVKVEGETYYPGEFAIAHADERISNLVKRSGGLTPYAYSKGATLIRRNEYFDELTEDQITEKNLVHVKNEISRDSLKMTESGRNLSSRITRKIEDRDTVLAEEEFSIDANELRQQAIIELGKSRDDIGKIQVKDTELIGINLEAILSNPNGPEDLILKEGDILSIPRELQTVRMRGEVLYPTSARYRSTSGFRDYISRAGGFTEKSRRGRSYVVYANGDVQRTKKFLFINDYPSIEPGAEIIVPAKPDREGISPQAWIGIATSLATLALLINNLTRQ
nr:polysaccharide biosynthesis protein [Cytophagales bacterium]